MKNVWNFIALGVLLVGCTDCDTRYGMHRLEDRLEGVDREVQAIFEQIVESNTMDNYHSVLEVLHPHLRLFNEPVSEGNRRGLADFRDKIRKRHKDLEFVVLRVTLFGRDEIVEVLISFGGELPELWYFLRKDGKLLLREANPLYPGVSFRGFVLELPEDVAKNQEQRNAELLAAEKP